MSLAVFDFDRTIVDDDSDATIIRKLREKKPPPEWEQSNHDWTPYMSDVFEHAYSAGLHKDDILQSIAGMRPTPGMPHLLRSLTSASWDVLLLTDANSVFVDHWLESHDLKGCVTEVITNRAWWQNGRLYIEPCMRACCPRCPANLCKGAALREWVARGGPIYTDIAYVGDGRNDFCPATTLLENHTVFPRQGYPLDKIINNDLGKECPEIKAKAVEWEDGYRILKELLPTSSLIGVNME